MSAVADLQARRRARDQANKPTRAPDIEMDAWVNNGEVDWIWTRGAFLDATDDHSVRTAALVDAAWLYGSDACPDSAPRSQRPAVWWLLGNDGTHVHLCQTSFCTGTSRRHALWLFRQWWRMTLYMARLARRCARGKG